jgi:hypothetical protein
MRSSPGRQRLFLVSALSVALLVASLPAAWAEEGLPVLWQGQVRTPAGNPGSGATVIAYARPPGVNLESGTSLAEVARTTADSSGQFTLRAAPSTTMQAAADAAGWVSVMVSAISPEGMAMAVDSVTWAPHPGYSAASADAPRGRWLTTPSEREAASQGGQFRATAAAPTAEVAKERPSVLRLSKGIQDLDTPRFAARGSSATSGCGLYKKEDAGVRPTGIGELFLQAGWGGTFAYTNTRTTSFQIGLSDDGKAWGVGGSTTVSRQVQGRSHGEMAARSEFQRYAYSADMIFKRFTWTCGQDAYFYSEQTVEPVDWTLGMHQDNVSLYPGCNPRFQTSVPAGHALDRDGGSSVTLQGAINVIGFTGAVTSTVSSNVGYSWQNTTPYERYVCGESDYLSHDTRAVTLA